MPSRLGRRIAAGHDLRPTSGTPQVTASKSKSSGPTPVAPRGRQARRDVAGARRQRIRRRGVTTNSLAATRECRGREGVRSSSAREGGRPGAEATEPASVSARRDSAHPAGRTGRRGVARQASPLGVANSVRPVTTVLRIQVRYSRTSAPDGGRALAVGTLDSVPTATGGRALRIVVCDVRARASGGPVTARPGRHHGRTHNLR
jgi:hypothetical protein